MEKFNNTSILTGYIKQLLANFNLPKIRVYTKEQQQYFDTYGVERYDVLETITGWINADWTSSSPSKYAYDNYIYYMPYIKDGIIQEYIDGKWIPLGDRDSEVKSYNGEIWKDLDNSKNKNDLPHVHYYNYGSPILNYTKKLQVTNNIYDSYTHEYLGDYLRFQRDYNDLNLMPLYNCFSNRTCNRLKIKSNYLISPEKYKEVEKLSIFITTDDYVGKYIYTTDYKLVTAENKDDLGIIPTVTQAYDKIKEQIGTFIFDTNDPKYKIYMMPIKLFQEYTVAIDSELPVELCCGIYGNSQDLSEKFERLPYLTYQKISFSKFASPFLYSKILNLNKLTLGNTLIEVAQNEENLKLFIKVPVNNPTTIVFLEGNYLNWNEQVWAKKKMQIIPITVWGEGDPTTDMVVEVTDQARLDTDSDSDSDSSEDSPIYYFDTKLGKLWELTLDLTWKYVGSLLPKQAVATNDPVYTDIKKDGLLIVDDKKQERLILTTNTLEPVPEEDYFTEYCRNTNTTALPTNLLYFNTYLKKLFVNPNTPWFKAMNHSVINIETLNNEKDINLITQLQLLRFNTKEQHPFADRLIEYLIENAITNVDEIADNTKRVQKIVEANFASVEYMSKFKGLWDYKLNKIIYEYINKHNNTYDINHDILGYVDKDVEKNYAHVDIYDIPNSNAKYKVSTSIMNAELDEEEK